MGKLQGVVKESAGKSGKIASLISKEVFPFKGMTLSIGTLVSFEEGPKGEAINIKPKHYKMQANSNAFKYQDRF